MTLTRRIGPGVVALLFLVTVFPVSGNGDETKGKAKGKSKSQVIAVDLKKLPPSLAKALKSYALKSPEDDDQSHPSAKAKKGKKKTVSDTKPSGLSLIDAIRIAERYGRGEPVKAQRHDKKGPVEFHIDFIDRDGTKIRVRLDRHGQILSDDSRIPDDVAKSADKKGKGKKQKKADD